MREGYIGHGTVGYINGANAALDVISDHTEIMGCNVENIFYTSAFQTGIDKFVLPQTIEEFKPQSQFVTNHISYLNEEAHQEFYEIIHNSFSNYLPKKALDVCVDVWGRTSVTC